MTMNDNLPRAYSLYDLKGSSYWPNENFDTLEDMSPADKQRLLADLLSEEMLQFFHSQITWGGRNQKTLACDIYIMLMMLDDLGYLALTFKPWMTVPARRELRTRLQDDASDDSGTYFTDHLVYLALSADGDKDEVE